MPSLRMGKCIAAADWRRLFLPGDDEISGPDKLEMDQFYKRHKTDPRSKVSAQRLKLGAVPSRAHLHGVGSWHVLASRRRAYRAACSNRVRNGVAERERDSNLDRAQAAESFNLDEMKQLTLLQWVSKNSEAYVRFQGAPSGAPRVYRISERVPPL